MCCAATAASYSHSLNSRIVEITTNFQTTELTDLCRHHQEDFDAWNACCGSAPRETLICHEAVTELRALSERQYAKRALTKMGGHSASLWPCCSTFHHDAGRPYKLHRRFNERDVEHSVWRFMPRRPQRVRDLLQNANLARLEHISLVKNDVAELSNRKINRWTFTRSQIPHCVLESQIQIHPKMYGTNVDLTINGIMQPEKCHSFDTYYQVLLQFKSTGMFRNT